MIAQTFSLPHAVGSLGVSKTRNSITTREVLMSVENRGVYGINKRLLDPRRPVDVLGAEDKEEGLSVYKAHLDFNPIDTLSYDLEVYHNYCLIKRLQESSRSFRRRRVLNRLHSCFAMALTCSLRVVHRQRNLIY